VETTIMEAGVGKVPAMVRGTTPKIDFESRLLPVTCERDSSRQ
jgi:hypothetical protein